MNRSGQSAALGAVPRIGLCAALLCACSGRGNDGDPAEGAFPNRRVTFESEGRVLGYVANRFGDTVSVVDLDRLELLGSAPVGRDPVEIDGPRHLAWDAQAASFYTVLGYPFDVVSPHAELVGVKARTGYVQMLAMSDLRLLGEVRVDVKADDLALSPDGAELVVTHFDTLRSLTGETEEERRAPIVLIQDPANIEAGTHAARSVPGCIAPSGVAYADQGGRAFVVCTGEDAIGVLDTVSGALLSTVRSGPDSTNKPWTISVEPSGSRFVVANQLSEKVSVFAAVETPKFLVAIPVGATPFHAAWVGDGEFVVAVQQPGGLARANVDRGEVTTAVEYAVDECENPSEPQLLTNGRLFLVCEGDHYKPGALVELDRETLTIIGRVELGLYLERMAVVYP